MTTVLSPLELHAVSDGNLDGGLVSSGSSVSNPTQRQLATSFPPKVHRSLRLKQDGPSEKIQLVDDFSEKMQFPMPSNSQDIVNILTRGVTIDNGMFLHFLIILYGFDRDVTITNGLISMYSKCGFVGNACVIFHQAQHRTVVSWTALITAFSNVGHDREALQLFWDMQRNGEKPNQITYTSILRSCARLGALAEGELMHRHIIEDGIEIDVFLSTALISFYVKCDALDNAHIIFNKANVRNAATWNAVLGGYAQCSDGIMSFKFFAQMQEEGTSPDRITMTSILEACASKGYLIEGMLVHNCIMQNQLEAEITIRTALVDMYGKCGALNDAYAFFREKCEQPATLWNALIGAYVEQDHSKEALEFFLEMEESSVMPDEVTYLVTLHACADLSQEQQGRLLHSSIVNRGFVLTRELETALIHMYGSCGALHDVHCCFTNMRQHDLVSWITIMTAYVRHGRGLDALCLFQEMLEIGNVRPDQSMFASILGACRSLCALDEGKVFHAFIAESEFELSAVINSALISMYGNCGALDDACAVFGKTMQQDVGTWNAIITSFSQHVDAEGVLDAFHRMQQEGILPNTITFVSLLSACRHAGLHGEGISFFSFMILKFGIIPTMEHYNVMVDLFGKMGMLDEAEDLIYSMPTVPDTVIWTTLMAAYQFSEDTVRGLYVTQIIAKLDTKSATPYVSSSIMMTKVGHGPQSS